MAAASSDGVKERCIRIGEELDKCLGILLYGPSISGHDDIPEALRESRKLFKATDFKKPGADVHVLQELVRNPYCLGVIMLDKGRMAEFLRDGSLKFADLTEVEQRRCQALRDLFILPAEMAIQNASEDLKTEELLPLPEEKVTLLNSVWQDTLREYYQEAYLSAEQVTAMAGVITQLLAFRHQIQKATTITTTLRGVSSAFGAAGWALHGTSESQEEAKLIQKVAPIMKGLRRLVCGDELQSVLAILEGGLGQSEIGIEKTRLLSTWLEKLSILQELKDLVTDVTKWFDAYQGSVDAAATQDSARLAEQAAFRRALGEACGVGFDPTGGTCSNSK